MEFLLIDCHKLLKVIYSGAHSEYDILSRQEGEYRIWIIVF